MPWCGLWGTTGSALWWVLPLIGLVFMGVMFVMCFRSFGVRCMGGRQRASSEVSDLRHQLDSLKEDVRKLVPQPSDETGSP